MVIKPASSDEVKEFQGLTFGQYIKNHDNRIAETRKHPWRGFKVMERV